MSDKPDCYKCKWRQDLPGNAHSRCVNPKIPDLGALGELAAMLGGGPTMRFPGIHVVGDSHGIRMGWFAWPLNYDPMWLKSCDSFEAKEAPSEAA